MATISADSIDELTPGVGCSIDGAEFHAGYVGVNTLDEVTADSGVTINGASFLDGAAPATTTKLYIDRQLSSVPDAITNGGFLWMDDGTQASDGDLWIRSNDGSTTASYCILGMTPSYSSVYSGADVSATQLQTLASITVPAGTYLVAWDFLVNGSAAVVPFARVDSAANGNVFPQSRAHAYQVTNSANYPVGAVFLLTTATADTLNLVIRGNTHVGNKLIDMFTGTIDGDTYNINNPKLVAWRIA